MKKISYEKKIDVKINFSVCVWGVHGGALRAPCVQVGTKVGILNSTNGTKQMARKLSQLLWCIILVGKAGTSRHSAMYNIPSSGAKRPRVEDRVGGRVERQKSGQTRQPAVREALLVLSRLFKRYLQF